MADNADLHGAAVEESKSVEGDFDVDLAQLEDEEENDAHTVRSLQQTTQRLASTQQAMQIQLQTLTDLMLRLASNNTTTSGISTPSPAEADVLHTESNTSTKTRISNSAMASQ